MSEPGNFPPSFVLTTYIGLIILASLAGGWIPLAVQWNIWVLPDLSLMVEPGLSLMVGEGTHGQPALDVGARYRLFRKVFAIGRVGVPGATIGVSILL